MTELIQIPRYDFQDNIHQEENYIKVFPTVSTENDYVPFQATSVAEVFIGNCDEPVLFYQLYVNSGDHGYIRTNKYSEFCNAVSGITHIHRTNRVEYTYTVSYRFIGRTEDSRENKYIASAGMVVRIDKDDTVLPLMILTIKRNHLKSVSRTNLQPRFFSVLIDEKFWTEHTMLYKKVKEAYIDKMQEAGIDIVFVKSIIDACYRSVIPKPKFKLISEMALHSVEMSQLVQEEIIK
jgi:hypothetical protein